MLDLDEQLRRYFDTTSPPLDIRVHEPVDPVVLRPLGVHRPDRKPAGRRLLFAAAVVMIAGLAAIVWLTGEDESGQLDTDTVIQPDDPVDPPPVSEAVDDDIPEPPILEWTKGSFQLEEPLTQTAVSDGTEFFVLGFRENGIDRSTDGWIWENEPIEDLPPPDDLTGPWTDTDAANGKILHLVVADGTARIHLIDSGVGAAFTETLPFDPQAGQELRGSVALNDEGEAVVVLWDHDPSSGYRTAAFHSPDGRSWRSIEADELSTGAPVELAAVGDEFLAVSGWLPWGMHSVDGAQWARVPLGGTARGLAEWNDGAVAFIGASRDRTIPTHRWHDGEWTPLAADLEPLDVEWCVDGVVWCAPLLAATEIGIVSLSPVPGSGGGTETWFVEFSVDGEKWSRQEFPGLGVRHVEAISDVVAVFDGSFVWIGKVG